ncbi:acetolactate synthase, large subunit, biosynthetic type [Thermosinus carboxydivorans Nor1]|uniref:Acetolactate synthase n=1 Tax=Thermosinus carboxydivorans Nor1 TaxID=401526 RepID=A1HPN8_9FIRM|nr:biosynthetic-type acetolactate synthase large subunit [Thermosinus carboxydivorans]EAX48008.1 acetolactate synthase, large subunit, biosynthetic type [Thermosinus carboxydivorans Nor1]
MKLSGSRIIVESLLRQGVDTVFGYPGGAIMPLYDALYDAPIRHILTVHEQAAAHAADGYARSSGRVGVCIATSGPGATNLVTGLATAYMDSSPVVAITGQVATKLIGRDAFQEIDVIGITMPITKHNFLVKNVSQLAATIDKAFAIATSGRPGPVLIDVPRDVLLAEADYCPDRPLGAETRKAQDSVPDHLVSAAVKALATAERPVLVIGGGVKTGAAEREVLALAEQTGMPVVSTLMGLGAFPADHRQFLGLTGMHGHKAANLTVHYADLVFAVGTRFNDRVTGDPANYSSGKTIIHLDVDAAEPGKNMEPEIALIGNVRISLAQILAALAQAARADLASWWEMIAEWRQAATSRSICPGQIDPAWLMRHMAKATAGQQVVWVTDVGQHQMWAAQHLKINGSRNWITSGGLGTMGFGLPAALGAQLACPDSRVILIAGDGGFKMTGMELYTAVNEKLPLICVILNNQALGMVRQWQKLFFQERYAATNLVPFDFVGFVRSFGIEAYKASTPDEFAAAFQQALGGAGPTVIIADIDPDCLVTPMVRPGEPIHKFLE